MEAKNPGRYRPKANIFIKDEIMNHFIITYRIKHDESYQGRYDAFVRKIKGFSPDSFWNETSSFYALQSEASARDICQVLCNSTGFDCAKDSVVVLDTTNRELATSGAIKEPARLKASIGFSARHYSWDVLPDLDSASAQPPSAS